MCTVLEQYSKGSLSARLIRPLNSWFGCRVCECGQLWAQRDVQETCGKCIHALLSRTQIDARVYANALLGTTCVQVEASESERLATCLGMFLQEPVNLTMNDESGVDVFIDCFTEFQGSRVPVRSQCTYGTFSSCSFDLINATPAQAVHVPPSPPSVFDMGSAGIVKDPDTEIVEWAAAIARRSIERFTQLLTVLQAPLISRALAKEDIKPGRVKAAWLTEFRRKFGHLSETDFNRRPEVRSFIVERANTADEEYARTAEWMNEKCPEGQPKLKPTFLPRRFTPLKEHPQFQERMTRLKEQFTVAEGANCLDYLNPGTVRASAARYAPDPIAGTATMADAYRVAEAILSEYPDLFAPCDVASTKLVASKKVKKYSCGMPFENQRAYTKRGKSILMRRFGDLYKTGWLNSLVDSTREVLVRGGAVPGMVHHVFVKDYIVERAKLEENPGKARTVIAQSAPWYLITKSLNYYFDKRAVQYWPETPPKAGMPLTGAGYNYVLNKYKDCSQVLVLDYTAADANENTQAIGIIKHLRKSLFAHLDDSKAIEAIIDASFDSLEAGHMISLLDGENLPKNRGLSTGQASVTTDGSWIVVGVKIDSLAHYWKVTPEEAFMRCVISNMHDDALVGIKPGFEVDPEKLCEVIKERWAIPCRLEWSGKNVIGAPWLRKNVHDSADYAADFELAGIERPNYAIVHDAESIKMRQIATLRASGLRFAYERTLGHLMLCCHEKRLYEFLANEAQLIRRKLLANPANRKWVKKRKVITRAEAIRRFYKPFNLPYRYTRRLSIYQVTKLAHDKITSSYFGVMNSLQILSGFSWKGERIISGSMDALPSRTEKLARGIDALGRYPDNRESYRGVVSRSPLAYVIDIDRYWARRVVDQVPEVTARAPLEWYYFATLVAAEYYRRARKARLNLPALAYASYTQDGAVIYSMLSFPYWLADGTSSPFLVGLMPKDPAYLLKRVVGFLIDLRESEYEPLFRPEGWRFIAGAIDKIGTYVKPQVLDDMLSWERGTCASPKWDVFVSTRVIPTLNSGAKTLLVTSPTGTGKTRELIPLLKKRYSTIIVGSPKNVTANEVVGATRLRRGCRYAPGKVYACTYGHLAARLSGGSIVDADSVLYMFDEVQDPTPDTVLALASLPKNAVVMYITATPESCGSFIYRPPEFTLDTGFPTRYSIDSQITPGFSVLDILGLPENRAEPGRILVFVPLLTDARRLYRQLDDACYDVGLFSRYDRLPDTKIIVSTQIGEAGVNIEGVVVVIDTGLRIVQHKGSLCMIPVDEATATQRRGRTGRFTAGRAYLLRDPAPFEVVNYPNVYMCMYRKEMLETVYGFATVPQGVKDESALFDIKDCRDTRLTKADWNICIQFYLGFESREDALRAWYKGAADHTLFDDKYESSAVLQDILDDRNWLANNTADYDLFSWQYRYGSHQMSNWVCLKDGRLNASASRGRMLIDVRGTSNLFTSGTCITIPGMPGRVTPLGPPIPLVSATRKRFIRTLLSSCGVDCTIAEYERYAGEFPIYDDKNAISDWVCECMAIFAQTLGCSFAIVSRFGARIVNAGRPIDALVAGALVGTSVVQLFTVYSTARPSMNALSRRLLHIHQTRLAKGLILSSYRTQVASDHAFKKYLPINYDFENKFTRWLTNKEAVLTDGLNDCVTELLTFYEPSDSINHAATMLLHVTDVKVLAESFAELHSCAVIVITHSECGCFINKMRVWPATKAAFSEVAWLVRSQHVQPMQSTWVAPREEYLQQSYHEAPKMAETWQNRFSEAGFAARVNLPVSDEMHARTCMNRPVSIGREFNEKRNVRKLSPVQTAYCAYASRGILSVFRKDTVKLLLSLMFEGFHVIAVHGKFQVSLKSQKFACLGYLCIEETSTKWVRRTLENGTIRSPATLYTECNSEQGPAIERLVLSNEVVPSFKRIGGIPPRAAGLFLLMEDPFMFAYMPAYTAIGRTHMEEMCGLKAGEIISYTKGILQPRIDKGQTAKLRKAARKFRKMHNLNRPTSLMIDGEVIKAKTLSTVSSI